MGSKLILIFIILSSSSGIGMAKIISLEKYSVDIGTGFVTLTNYPGEENYFKTLNPLDTEAGILEGFAWRYDLNDEFNFVIIDQIKEIRDPLTNIEMTLSSFLNHFFGQSMPILRYASVRIPYPGYITSFRVDNSSKIMTAYVGWIDNDTQLLVLSFDEPNSVTSMLRDIRVISKGEENNKITAKIAANLQS
jgi:hypothetical protein